MILNLERKKFVDSFQRLWIVTHDPHLAAPAGGLKTVIDRCTFHFHHRNSGRNTVVNEHWNFEGVGAEHRRNVGQMHANLVPRGIVLLGLDTDLDGAPVWKQREVMSRGFMGEAHCVIATIINLCRVITGLLMLVVHGAFHRHLGLCSCGQI